MIEIESVSKSFGRQLILDEISLTISSGDRIAMLGRNGAGKTTLIRTILGEYIPDSGKVLIDGYSPITSRVESLKNISFVPQLPPPIKLTVHELINYTSKLSSFDEEEVIENCAFLDLDIKDNLNKSFFKLSGGMKQKVMIGIALARDSKILIFDEPTANLDFNGRDKFNQQLMKLNKDKILIFISHRIDDLSDIITREIELDLGKVIKDEKI